MNDQARRRRRLDLRVQTELARVEARLNETERRLASLEKRIDTYRLAEAKAWEEHP